MTKTLTELFSGVAPANQTKERSVHELFTGAIPEQKFNVNRACFPKEKHQKSQTWAKFMNFFVLPLSLVWFAAATPDIYVIGRPIFIQCGCWGDLCSPYEVARPQAAPSPVLDKNRAPMGPEILSSTWAGLWRKAPMAFPDSSSVLDIFQSESNNFGGGCKVRFVTHRTCQQDPILRK